MLVRLEIDSTVKTLDREVLRREVLPLLFSEFVDR
jgi:hypothetical protein